MDVKQAGAKGGKRRKQTQTAAQLSAQGRKAAKARWRNKPKKRN
jgi:hypothetical protein